MYKFIEKLNEFQTVPQGMMSNLEIQEREMSPTLKKSPSCGDDIQQYSNQLEKVSSYEKLIFKIKLCFVRIKIAMKNCF